MNPEKISNSPSSVMPEFPGVGFYDEVEIKHKTQKNKVELLSKNHLALVKDYAELKARFETMEKAVSAIMELQYLAAKTEIGIIEALNKLISKEVVEPIFGGLTFSELAKNMSNGE